MHASANSLVPKKKEMNCFQCLAKQTIKITTFVNQGEAKKNRVTTGKISNYFYRL